MSPGNFSSTVSHFTVYSSTACVVIGTLKPRYFIDEIQAAYKKRKEKHDLKTEQFIEMSSEMMSLVSNSNQISKGKHAYWSLMMMCRQSGEGCVAPQQGCKPIQVEAVDGAGATQCTRWWCQCFEQCSTAAHDVHRIIFTEATTAIDAPIVERKPIGCIQRARSR